MPVEAELVQEAPGIAGAALDCRLEQVGFVRLPLLQGHMVEALSAIFKDVRTIHEAPFSATLLCAVPEQRRQIHKAILSIVEEPLCDLLPCYRPIYCGFAVKAGEGGAMPLHQDITMSLGPRPALSLWAPLVATNLQNGCLEVVPGSHALAAWPRAPGTPFAAAHLEEDIRKHYLLPVPMRAGEGLIMSHDLFHSSGANRTRVQRPVVACILIPRGQPLLYCHRRRHSKGASIEVFEVGEDFYLGHRIGTCPAGRPSKILPERLATPALGDLPRQVSVPEATGAGK